MSHAWGRTDAAGTWPHPKPAWTIAILVVAVLSAVAIGAYRYAAVWTPLQRWYLSTYLRSDAMSGLGFTANGHYRLLQVVDRKGSRLALDDEVRPVTTANGETRLGLTEAAVYTGDRQPV